MLIINVVTSLTRSKLVTWGSLVEDTQKKMSRYVKKLIMKGKNVVFYEVRIENERDRVKN